MHDTALVDYTYPQMISALALLLAVSPPATDDKIVADALARINSYRTLVGLKTVRLHPVLSKAAAGHAKYMTLNNVFTHIQQQGKKGFTGADPSNRARKAGYAPEYVLEDIATGSLAISFNLLLNGPYHRQPFIEPETTEMGIGADGKNVVFLFPIPEGEPAVFPLPGQKNVPTEWKGYDVPSPYRMHKGAKPPFGTPVQIFLRDMSGLTGIKFSVRTAQGKILDCYLNTPENDDSLQDAIMLIPKMPLAPGTTYIASFSAYQSSGKLIAKTWTFTTAK